MTSATFPDSFPDTARVAHRSTGRLRLRLPQRRHDLAFFLEVYEALRGQPEIDEVTINPTTGSVLLWYDPAEEDALAEAVGRTGLLQLHEGDLHPQQDERHLFHVSINDMRITIFLIMTALSIHQLLKGQLVAPALTMLLYLIDLAVGMRMERDAAAGHDHDPSVAGPTGNI
jgi:hypothetical protein